MKKRIFVLWLCLLLLCGCAPSAMETPTPSGQDASGNWIFDDVVTVGRVVPLTGPLASFGEGTPYVEQTAIDAVNARGGVVLDGKRCKLELVCVDSGSNVEQAAEAARRQAGDHDGGMQGGMMPGQGGFGGQQGGRGEFDMDRAQGGNYADAQSSATVDSQSSATVDSQSSATV